MSAVPIPDGDTLTWDAVDAELNGDVDICGDLQHTLDAGERAWTVVGDWTKELLVRFPQLRTDEAFHVAVIYYFG